jgi:hypothetical protein
MEMVNVRRPQLERILHHHLLSDAYQKMVDPDEKSIRRHQKIILNL